jgi:hypothetical protein
MSSQEAQFAIRNSQFAIRKKRDSQLMAGGWWLEAGS